MIASCFDSCLITNPLISAGILPPTISGLGFFSFHLPHHVTSRHVTPRHVTSHFTRHTSHHASHVKSLVAHQQTPLSQEPPRAGATAIPNFLRSVHEIQRSHICCTSLISTVDKGLISAGIEPMAVLVQINYETTTPVIEAVARLWSKRYSGRAHQFMHLMILSERAGLSRCRVKPFCKYWIAYLEP